MVTLVAEIGVGAMVRLRTDGRFEWVVVRVGRWWLWRGLLLLRRHSGANCYDEWVYPSEVELVPAK